VVEDAVARALAEDLGPSGDITAALLAPTSRAEVVLRARAVGILAGTACVEATYARLDPALRMVWEVRDGAVVHPGQAIAAISGLLPAILTGERTALNFLCHLSGVATLTRRFVDAAAPLQVWDTRKTLPGLRALEKAAVRAGGGVNHRSSLSDMVLIKDNHLGALGIADAVSHARALWPDREVEVECDRPEQVREALSAAVDVIMLDNMTPTEAGTCVAIVRSSARPRTPIEISGGVTLENVRQYASSGADRISTSEITQSASALDIGLDFSSRGS
jgi:nicotinate-nucleotide pyrophosphorylase (carboxylating)